MTQLTTDKLKEWGEEGFLVGPDESEEAFVKRVDFLKRFSTAPDVDLPSSTTHVTEAEWRPPLERLKEVAGCAPMWVIAYYSNRKLAPWQGAAAWIHTSSEGIQFSIIQLNKGFKRGRYFFYSRDEVLCHEMMHAVRSSYLESRFEEIFAYALSKKKWRAFLGPIFRTPSQALIFSLTLMACMGAQTIQLFFFDMPWIKLLTFFPLAYLSILIVKLIRDQHLLKKSLRKIRRLFPKQKDPFSLALRLTDAEMVLFAKSAPHKLRTYIEESDSLRWKQIHSQFF